MRKALSTLLLHSALFVAAVAPAGAATIVTDLYLASPLKNTAGADRVSFQWSTFLTGGIVAASNLSDLTMRFYNGSNLVYTDVAIAGGVVQPFGGVNRTSSDIFFNYNLNNRTLLEIGNLQTTNPAGAIGTQYYVTDNLNFPADSMVGIQAIVNGSRQSLKIDLLTRQVSTTVPEPATNAIVGLGLTGIAWWRRRRA